MSRIRLRDSVQFPVWSIHFIMTPPRSEWHYTNQTKLFCFLARWLSRNLQKCVSLVAYALLFTNTWAGRKGWESTGQWFCFICLSALITRTPHVHSPWKITTRNRNIVLMHIWTSYLCQVKNLEFRSPSTSTCLSGKWDQKPLPSAGGGLKDLQDKKKKDVIFMLLHARSIHQFRANGEVWHFRLRKWPRAAKCRPPTRKACGVCRSDSGSWVTEHLTAITAHL